MSSGSTSDGSVLSIVGVTPSDGTIPGLATTNSTLGPTIRGGYSVTFSNGDHVIGLPFFMQNSVMFDLTGQTIGYTPFYVTAADLATTANGPLIVGASNVPLGLAGVISGPGGVTVGSGGMVQLSATNTYSGVTTIGAASGGSAAGLLLVSGPGSIASSSGVVNNGVFDISRAWAPVAIQTLSGSGQVYLGAQNLVLTNASGTYGGTISDGGSYPVTRRQPDPGRRLLHPGGNGQLHRRHLRDRRHLHPDGSCWAGSPWRPAATSRSPRAAC